MPGQNCLLTRHMSSLSKFLSDNWFCLALKTSLPTLKSRSHAALAVTPVLILKNTLNAFSWDSSGDFFEVRIIVVVALFLYRHQGYACMHARSRKGLVLISSALQAQSSHMAEAHIWWCQRADLQAGQKANYCQCPPDNSLRMCYQETL